MSLKTNKCCCSICEPCESAAPHCDNCECVPRCLCVRQKILYDDDNPPNQEWLETTTQRAQLACWDPDIGDHGGWRAEFPADTPPCWPAVTVVIELVIVDGVCSLQATVDGETKPAESGLNCATMNTFSGTWHFDTDDPTNPSLPAEHEISVFNWICGDAECVNPCCLNPPSTLTATIQGWNFRSGPGCTQCTDSFDHTLSLDTSLCGRNHIGTLHNIPWSCAELGSGVVSLTLQVACIGCVRLAIDDTCFCENCEGTENPGVDGCYSMVSFHLTPYFGSASPTEPSRCGYQSGCPWPTGAFVQSSCDPIYAEFYFTVPGEEGCCNYWHVIVTE